MRISGHVIVCKKFNLSLVAEKPVWFVMWSRLKSGWVEFTQVHSSSNVEWNQLSESHEIRVEISHEISPNAALELNFEDPYCNRARFKLPWSRRSTCECTRFPQPQRSANQAEPIKPVVVVSCFDLHRSIAIDACAFDKAVQWFGRALGKLVCRPCACGTITVPSAAF
jgi:hypothetical protein